MAIQETDIFLQKLFQRSITMQGKPELSFNELLQSYELRHFMVTT